MCYQRFTLPLRYQLQALHQAEQANRAIAEQLGVHRSTITRELARVSPYGAEAAHQHAQNEQKRRHPPRIQHGVWESINEQLRRFLSPEQIRGRRQLEGQDCPSVERLYQHIYAHPDLTQYLRQGQVIPN